MTPPKSKYTYRHLQQLSSYAVDTPLRVIALIHLDAFYVRARTPPALSHTR